MPKETQWTNKTALIFLATIFAGNVLLSVFSAFLMMDANYIATALERGSAMLAIFALVIACWFIAIKVLKLNAGGPVPWYASPLVWFSPIFIALMFSMFRS